MAKNNENDASGKSQKQFEFFDSESYIIQLNCKREEFFSALEHYNDKREANPILRSFLHEHTHFLQHATTPVGYYLKLIRDFQLMYLTKITEESLNTQKFSYPMMPLILDTKSKSVKHPEPAHYYYFWVLAEIIRLILIGDLKTLSYYTDRMMHGEGFIDYFMELEQYLNSMLSGRFQKNSRKLIKHDKEMFDRLLLGLFSNITMGLNITSAMESQALLSEYFFDETADEFLIKATEKSTYQDEQIHYLLPLRLYQTAHSFDLKNRSDFLRFKLGFNAICQITFHAPILPFQDKIGLCSLGDMEVNSRFNELLSSPKVSPPKSPMDYDRYINELLTERSYISLEDSYKEIYKNKEMILYNSFNTLVGHHKEKEHLFLSAQSHYMENKINYYYFMSGQTSSPGMYCIKYSDTKLTLPLEKTWYCFQDLIYQYYIELLYGYEWKRPSNHIAVYPAVELSDDTMDILQNFAETFTVGLRKKSGLFPQMKIMNRR